MQIIITILISFLCLPVAKKLCHTREGQTIAPNFTVTIPEFFRQPTPMVAFILFPLFLLSAFTGNINAQSSGSTNQSGGNAVSGGSGGKYTGGNGAPGVSAIPDRAHFCVNSETF